MKKRMITPVAVTVLMLSAACSGPAPSEAETAQSDFEQSVPAAGESSPAEEESDRDETAAETDEEVANDSQSPTGLTVTASGEEITFTDVYCKVSDGQLRHLIAKTNNRPPLLEVTPGEFAMLKVGQRGAPEKNTAPSGIDYFPEGVVFDSAPIGSVTVDGSLGCTQIDGE